MDTNNSELSLSWLLKTWRTEVAKKPQTEIVKNLYFNPSTLSQWENGTRHKNKFNHDYLTELDKQYSANGALKDMAFALCTPFKCEPNSVWWHSFNSAGDNSWVWIRMPDSTKTMSVIIEWGPVFIKLPLSYNKKGYIVYATTVSTIPIKITLDPAGWVDFGLGVIPSELGIPLLNGRKYMHIIRPEDSIFKIFSNKADEDSYTRGKWKQILAKIVGSEQKYLVSEAYPDNLKQTEPVAAPLPKTPTLYSKDQCWKTPSQLRDLREARFLSQKAVADMLSDMATLHHNFTISVTEDTISKTLEQRGGRPQGFDYPFSMLDQIYGCDGAIAIERFEHIEIKDQSLISINVPGFWVGPIWLQFSSETRQQARANLTWGPWHRNIEISNGCVATTWQKFDSDRQLLQINVEFLQGWTIDIGMGTFPEATDINVGWKVVSSVNAIRKVCHEMAKAYKQAFK